jgi:hypothetical protein
MSCGETGEGALRKWIERIEGDTRCDELLYFVHQSEYRRFQCEILGVVPVV